ncbi:MAG: response regulator [Candidatus Heimdallarchaeota archaeon]
MKNERSAEILLVEDNPGDVRLTDKALEKGKILYKLHVVEDGVEAMAFLRQEGKYADVPRPDIILLDLNMPRKDGREVLEELKNDSDLRCIPVIVLTSSSAEEDIMKSYNSHANCYCVKPVKLPNFMQIISQIEQFWFSIVTLPQNPP